MDVDIDIDMYYYNITETFTYLQNKDHCGQVESRCKEKETGNGPVTVRTPYGLGVEEWAEGLEKYSKTYQNLDGVDNYDIKK